MNTLSSKNISNIKDRLNSYKRTFFKREFIKGIIICLCFLLSSYFLFTSLEYWGHFSNNVRRFLFFTFILLIILLFFFFIIRPLYHFISANKKMTDEEAAKQLGQYFPEIKDKLLNLIQLQNLETSNSELILASIEQKSNAVSYTHLTLPTTSRV